MPLRNALSPLDPNTIPTAGEFVPDRDFFLSNIVVGSSGNMLLNYFTARRTEDINTLTVITGGTAAAATPTTCLLGVYSEATNGDLTLVGTIANDTTLFAAASTEYARALVGTWTKLQGQRYALATLVISAATVPSFTGHLPSTAGAVLYPTMAVAPRKAARVVTVAGTSLPSSVAAGSIAGYGMRVGFRLS